MISGWSLEDGGEFFCDGRTAGDFVARDAVEIDGFRRPGVGKGLGVVLVERLHVGFIGLANGGFVGRRSAGLPGERPVHDGPAEDRQTQQDSIHLRCSLLKVLSWKSQLLLQ